MIATIKESTDTVTALLDVLSGQDTTTPVITWPDQALAGHKSDRRRHVTLPEHVAHLGVLYGKTQTGTPRAWVLEMQFRAPNLAWLSDMGK